VSEKPWDKSGGVIFDFFKDYYLPCLAVLSFFPIYFWSYLYIFPRDVRLVLGGGSFSNLATELIATFAACGLIAKFCAYQIAPVIAQIRLTTHLEPRLNAMKPFKKIRLNIPSFFVEETFLTFVFFLIAFACYFLGFSGVLLAIFYCWALFSAVGHSEKARLIAEGNEHGAYLSVSSAALGAIENRPIKDIGKSGFKFLSITALTLAMVLGGSRGISVLRNGDSTLSMSSQRLDVKLIAATDFGLVFIESGDASLIKLMLRRPVNFFVVNAGNVTCLGAENLNCR
jgi:hypothetical protein